MQQNTKYVWVILGILVLIAGGTYFLSTRNNVTDEGLDSGNNGEALGEDTIMITAKHSFRNGKHIIAGEVQVPTPCTSLQAKETVGSPDSSKVVIAFNTINESEVCAQVIANRRFKVEFSAPEKASITATWNGAPAILNLIPVGPGEDLENFEIFLKG